MYSFYLTQDREKILLPVPPAELKLRINNNNEVINLLNLGDVNILKQAGLTDVDFTVLLPGKNLPFAIYEAGFRSPTFFTEKFKAYKTSQKALRLTIARTAHDGAPLFDQTLTVSLERYTLTEVAGEEGDIYVSLEFKEYRDHLTPKIEITTDEMGENPLAYVTPARAAKEPARQYTVKTGDNLWLIAKRELNDGNKHTEIAELNDLKDPSLIQPGQVLQLP